MKVIDGMIGVLCFFFDVYHPNYLNYFFGTN